MAAVTIHPVMAKARIVGHFVEAQVLEALGVDYVDESEVLTPADETNHIDKRAPAFFRGPVSCAAAQPRRAPVSTRARRSRRTKGGEAKGTGIRGGSARCCATSCSVS